VFSRRHGPNLNLQYQLEVTGLHHTLNNLKLQKEPLAGYGQDGGHQTQKEKSLLCQEWGVLKQSSPQPSHY
jgi:hypothetical protein